MQENALTGLDLTSDPLQANPTPAAKVAQFSNRTAREDLAELDLSDEEPSEYTIIRHSVRPDRSTLAVDLSLWPPRAKLQFRVEGTLSWAAPFSAIVLLLSVLAGIIIPVLTVDQDAGRSAWLAVAGTSAGSVLVTGTLCLLVLRLYKRPTN